MTHTLQKLHERRGTTLVELIVCMGLLGIFCVALIALIHPCAEMFTRVQSLSRAQMVGDTVIDTLRGEVLHAQGTIRFTDSDPTNPDTVFGYNAVEKSSAGNAVEFLKDGYYEVIDAGAVPTEYYRKQDAPIVINGSTGTLHQRYYTKLSDSDTATYNGSYYLYKKGAAYAGYAYTNTFADGFYMGNTVRLLFELQGWYDDETIGRARATSIKVTVTVLRPGTTAAEEPVVLSTQQAILDLMDEPVLLMEGHDAPPARVGE